MRISQLELFNYETIIDLIDYAQLCKHSLVYNIYYISLY